MNEIITWTASQTAAKIRARDVSIEEITKAHLQRIGDCEPDLRAVVEVFEDQSLALARQKDSETGPDSPALHGLPTTIKSNVDFAGLPNPNGIPAMNVTPVASDAPVLTNLKNAGIIPIGRTNTPEFSLRWFTSNPIWGVTENPVNRALTPGGSSGGASAAVACGMGVIGHGNDLGGSLRYPAYCCGLTSLRPSLGRVPAFNPSAPAERPASLQMMSVQGTIVRSVEDARLSLRALEVRSPHDPLWNAAPTSGRPRGAQLKVGVTTDPFGDGVASSVSAAMEQAAAALTAQGCEIQEASPPLAVEIANTWGHLLTAETDVMMMETMAPVASTEVLALLQGYTDHFGIPDLKGFMQAQAMRLTALRAWNQMFDGIDVLMMPVSGQPPFGLDQDFRQPETLPDILRAQRFLFLANVLGLPSVAVPTGIKDGVPMGVQIIGPCRDDDLCLDVAELLETALGGPAKPVDP